MSRSAAAVLLLAVAGPAAAQPPVPPPPVPVQPQLWLPSRVPPGGPAQPPLAVPAQEFVVPQGLIIEGGGPRRAGAAAPKLVVARVNDGALVWSSTEMLPATRQIDVQVIENGQPVTRKTTITTMQPQTRENSIPLDGLKARDAAGKRIQPLALEIRLGKGAGVVLHTGPIPDPIKAMFKDDAVFLELTAGAGQFAQPGGFIEGTTFDFVRPAPAPGGAPPQPGFRVFPAPATPPPAAPPARVRPTPAPPADPPPPPR